MVVKVYGFVASGPTQIAVLTLKELGVPYEFVAVDAASLEHKSPAHLKKQPFGQVPYIVCCSRGFCDISLPLSPH